MSGQIFVQMHWAMGLVGGSFLLHAVMIVLGRRLFIRTTPTSHVLALFGETIRLVLLSLWLFAAHSLAIWMWAAVYHHVGMSPTVEEALYFALTTYTTLGFGDIVPPQDWRLLTGASSANGLLLFGLSAAVLVDATERIRTGGR